MAIQTHKSREEFAWVLNKIQTSRTHMLRGIPSILEYLLEEIPDSPSVKNQYTILEHLRKKCILKNIRRDYHDEKKDESTQVKVAVGASLDNIFDYSIIPTRSFYEVDEKKLYFFLLEYKLIPNPDSVIYLFKKSDEKGILLYKNYKLIFSGLRSLLIYYFYKEIETFSFVGNYKDFNNYFKLFFKDIDKFNSRKFREEIDKINKRVFNRTNGEIKKIIRKTNQKKNYGKNEYKWKILFEDIK